MDRQGAGVSDAWPRSVRPHLALGDHPAPAPPRAHKPGHDRRTRSRPAPPSSQASARRAVDTGIVWNPQAHPPPTLRPHSWTKPCSPAPRTLHRTTDRTTRRKWWPPSVQPARRGAPPWGPGPSSCTTCRCSPRWSSGWPCSGPCRCSSAMGPAPRCTPWWWPHRWPPEWRHGWPGDGTGGRRSSRWAWRCTSRSPSSSPCTGLARSPRRDWSSSAMSSCCRRWRRRCCIAARNTSARTDIWSAQAEHSPHTGHTRVRNDEPQWWQPRN